MLVDVGVGIVLNKESVLGKRDRARKETEESNKGR